MKSIFESVERIAGTSQKTARMETVTLASRSACRRNLPDCDEEDIICREDERIFGEMPLAVYKDTVGFWRSHEKTRLAHVTPRVTKGSIWRIGRVIFVREN
ncbi:MAG: hypothetical protein LBQ62_04365 [Candidatus Accumulibacter sp.]|jgi:hypothetical protein|nr:hypothetical protein [Accumulibacter sp.]